MNTQRTLQPQLSGAATWRRLDESAADSWPATITCIDGRRLTIVTGHRVPARTPVRIDKDGSLLLGEVLHCRTDSAVWETLVQIDQVILSTPDLALLVRAIADPAGQMEPAANREAVPTEPLSR